MKVTYEIIIIDNSYQEEIIKNVDQLIDSFSQYKHIRFFRNKTNIGMFDNWNQCLKKAKGKYITLLNDDLLDYHFVENVIKDIKGERMLIYDYEFFMDKFKER